MKSPYFRNENFINTGFVYHEYVKMRTWKTTYVGRENALLSAVI